MRNTIVTIAILAAFFGAQARTFAQDAAKPPLGFSVRPFDEYGDLRSCDHKARLDNYAIQLQNEPRAYGYIVVYAPESANKLIRERITDYLVNSRGIPAKRLKTIDAGLNTVLTEARIKLWIVPRGADFDVEKNDVNLEAVKGMLVEYQNWDGIQIESDDIEEDPGTGAGVGNVTYAAVEEILKAQKQSVAHVVGFNGADAVPGAWRRVAESTVEDLKRFGLGADRFKIAYGGRSKETKIQIWILPKGETPPVKDPASEAAPAKAVQIDEFDEFQLAHPKNQLAVFNRLLTVMRDHRNLRACLIVRMEVPEVSDVPDEEELPELPAELTDTPDPQPADVFKLVDKWKSDLTEKHQIRLDRIVVLYSKALPGHLSSIDLWLVPPGQPLPNPDAEPEDEKPSDVVKDTERRP